MLCNKCMEVELMFSDVHYAFQPERDAVRLFKNSLGIDTTKNMWVLIAKSY